MRSQRQWFFRLFSKMGTGDFAIISLSAPPRWLCLLCHGLLYRMASHCFVCLKINIYKFHFYFVISAKVSFFAWLFPQKHKASESNFQPVQHPATKARPLVESAVKELLLFCNSIYKPGPTDCLKLVVVIVCFVSFAYWVLTNTADK